MWLRSSARAPTGTSWPHPGDRGAHCRAGRSPFCGDPSPPPLNHLNHQKLSTNQVIRRRSDFLRPLTTSRSPPLSPRVGIQPHHTTSHSLAMPSLPGRQRQTGRRADENMQVPADWATALAQRCPTTTQTRHSVRLARPTHAPTHCTHPSPNFRPCQARPGQACPGADRPCPARHTHGGKQKDVSFFKHASAWALSPSSHFRLPHIDFNLTSHLTPHTSPPYDDNPNKRPTTTDDHRQTSLIV